MMMYITFFLLPFTLYAEDEDTISSSPFRKNVVKVAILIQDSAPFIIPKTDGENASSLFAFSGRDIQIIEKIAFLLANSVSSVVFTINRNISSSKELFSLLENGKVDIVIYSKIATEDIAYNVLSSMPYASAKTLAFIRHGEGTVFSNIKMNDTIAVHNTHLYETLFDSSLETRLIHVLSVEDAEEQLESRYIYAALLNLYNANIIIQKTPTVLLYYNTFLFDDEYVLIRNMYVKNNDLISIINSVIQSTEFLSIDNLRNARYHLAELKTKGR